MRLGEVLTLDKNNTITIEDDKTYIIAGMQSYGKGVANKRIEKGSDMKMKKYQVIKDNQLMWCKVDTKNGAFGVTTDENIGVLASTNMALANINLEKVNPKFLQLLFTIPYFYKYINELCTGTTNRKYLKVAEVLEKIEIPDLSLKEQDKIIDKYYEVEKFQRKLTQEIKNQELYINKLRKSILQEAVKGKLVTQDESDECASVLLERIKDDKDRLVKEKKIKKEKPLAEISEDEVPYELPKGWEWARLGSIIKTIIGGGTPSKANNLYWNGEIKWASVKDMTAEVFINNTIDSITIYGLENSSSNLIPEGNLIISTRMGLGKININKIDMAINQDLKAIILTDDFDKKYFYYMYKSLNIVGTGTTVKGIKQDDLLNKIIAVPPLNEQKRIAEKIDELTSICEELDLKIVKSKKYGEKMMESILKNSFKA